jgi:DNA-directed RNA polymerase specialized sigma24 family protein
MQPRSVPSGDWKGDAFRRTLVGIVRKRVPERDVEDIVQATLAEALSPSAPADDEARKRWLIGVARHKIVDRHRRGRRESFEVPEVHVDAPPHSEQDLVRWAASALPAPTKDGEEPHKTLEWMMREGEGEKLEAIAASEKIPAPRVRKRVSRLRSHLRAQWRKEVALLAALGILATIVWIAQRTPTTPIAHDVVPPAPSELAPSPEERARVLRDDALDACDRGVWTVCADGLDRAKALDTAGESDPRVIGAREAIRRALEPAPAPSAVPSSVPVPTAVPSARSVPTSMPVPTSAPAPRPNKKSGPSKVPSLSK